jgi:DNA-binding NarL/FixJ family response regulator
MIRILSACKNNVVAEGIQLHIESKSDLLGMGKVNSFSDLIKTSQQAHPDLLLLCQNFNDNRNIVELIRKYLQLFITTKIIVIACKTEKNIVQEIMFSGVKGYVDIMNSPLEIISESVRLVHEGQFYLCPTALACLELKHHSSDALSKFEDGVLGDREIEVLKYVAYGYSSKIISRELKIATSTVDVHRKNIMNKLNLHNASDLTRYAIQKKVIEI